jgi:protein-S-isoprenylcysteine O-methyltransferase Ste14
MSQADHDHPNVKIPPPILTLLHFLAAFGFNGLLPLPAPPRLVELAGLALTLAGFVLGLLAVRALLAARTTLSPHGSSSAVVSGGPYRFSRNPIYVGYVLTLMGLPLAVGSYWGLVLTPVHVLLMDWLVIRHEERYLALRFGAAYTEYSARVRRWL